MTDEQRRELERLVKRMRSHAAKFGPLHGWWDTIFDIEAFLQGRPTLLKGTAEEWLAAARCYVPEVGGVQ